MTTSYSIKYATYKNSVCFFLFLYVVLCIIHKKEYCSNLEIK